MTIEEEQFERYLREPIDFQSKFIFQNFIEFLARMYAFNKLERGQNFKPRQYQQQRKRIYLDHHIPFHEDILENKELEHLKD